MNSGMNDVKRLFAEKKISEAVALLKELAEQQNDPVAQFYLASLHMKGAAGVPKDLDAAKNYLVKAADAGLPDAKKLLEKIEVKPAAHGTEVAQQNVENTAAEQNNAVEEPVKAEETGADNSQSSVNKPEQPVDTQGITSETNGQGTGQSETNNRVIQDKSLVRLSSEKSALEGMAMNVIGAMVVMLILFRFVSSIFEPSRSSVKQQQSTVATQNQMVNADKGNVKPAAREWSPFKTKQSTQQAPQQNTQQNTNTGNDNVPIVITGANHSSADQEGNYVHSAKLAVDGNTSTCWSEGVKGLGVGENIEIHFDRDCKVSGMDIWIGHQKSRSLFTQNARPVALRVEGSDGSSEVYNLKDAFGGQRVNFKQPITVNKIKLVVVQVARGNKYEDTCISEVKFF